MPLIDVFVFQVRAEFKNVNAATLYDVLHDPFYRKTWDSSMIEGYEMCCLNPNNDIGYFACEYACVIHLICLTVT